MFTGIITQIGKVRAVRKQTGSMTAEIECSYPAIVLGESIAVDGVCLTAVTVGQSAFSANISSETLARSTLDRLAPGVRVNLERALAVGDRLGGHIVAGHVDGVGRVQVRERHGEYERFVFESPPEVHRYIAEKGSVAIDGVSLTVNAVSNNAFEVMLVPFTLAETTLSERKIGDRVNLEADVIARYVARALQVRSNTGTSQNEGNVTLDLLDRAGFLHSSNNDSKQK
jgi:riboflavin synthase